MKRITILMFAFAIAFAASSGNASATAVNSGHDFDVGHAIGADDSIQMDVNTFVMQTCGVDSYEYVSSGSDFGDVEMSSTLKSVTATMDDGSASLYVQHSSTAFITVYYHPEPTDADAYRRARDWLNCGLTS